MVNQYYKNILVSLWFFSSTAFILFRIVMKIGLTCARWAFNEFIWQIINSQQMASLKDKLKSKIKSKNEPETMQCFDQNALNVQLIQGRSQLQQIKIYCSWNQNKYNSRVPRLRCKWYNRTEKNYEEIQGIDEEVYQPSILDIGSIIEVTCIPELPGVNYEGMPILLKSQPIVLSSQTEQQAKKWVDSGKGKLLVQLKQIRIAQNPIGNVSQALLQFDKGILSLMSLKVSQSRDQKLISLQIMEDYPRVKIHRRNSKQMTIFFNSEEYAIVVFKNSELRDHFALFLKIFVGRKSLDEEGQKIEIEKPQPNVPDNYDEEKIETTELSPQTSSEQKVAKEQRGGSGLQVGTKVAPASTIQLLQLVSLKDQLKASESDKNRLAKQLQQERQKRYNFQNQMLENQERLKSATRNYFQLQKQLKKVQSQLQMSRKQLNIRQQSDDSKQQQLMYYRNQIKLLQNDKVSQAEQLSSLRSSLSLVQNQLANYRQLYGSGEGRLSYRQLLQDLTTVKKINSELQLKYEYESEERQKLEQNLRNNRAFIEKVQSEKRYIEKKYESLSNQLNSPIVSPAYSSKRSEKSSECSPVGSMIFEETSPFPQNKETLIRMVSCEGDSREKQLLDLKKELKVYVDQNNYLRGLLNKQKKSGSKTQLKLQLYEAKKIVGRLSQALGQKDHTIVQLKQINKQMNRRCEQLAFDYQAILDQSRNKS